MRYTVKFIVNGVLNSDVPTDNIDKAIQREAELRERGVEDVWIADAVQEILVG